MKDLPVFLFAVFFSLQSTAQTNLDSLWNIWQDESQTIPKRASAFKSYIWRGFLFTDPDSAFVLAQELQRFGESHQYEKAEAFGYRLMGVSQHMKSDYPRALDYLLQGLKMHEALGEERLVSFTLGNIGSVYFEQGDYEKALDYQFRGLKIKEELEDRKGIASSLTNIGNAYYMQEDFSKALEYYQRSLIIKEELGDEKSVSNLFTNIGNIYADLENYPEALEYYQNSIAIKEALDDRWGITYPLAGIGNVFLQIGDQDKALLHCKRALEISKDVGLLLVEKEACECVYKTYKTMGDAENALAYHEQFTVLNDSIFNEENTKRLTQLEMQHEFDKKEAIMNERSEKQKIGLIAAVGGLLLLLSLAFSVYNGKKKSDELLLNILPEETAQELKEKGHSDAQLIDHVTVLFTDFKGFTALSEQVTPKELVNDLHSCFSAFDEICEKYGIEKIKTIGDAYMAAGGLPSPNTTHALDIVNAALEMAKVVENGKAKKIEQGLPFFEIRIGVHTGPVVAGIVGIKKFQYDIWGDTVNTASRMESSGEVGKVNISQTTYELVKDQFTCEYRGEVEAKGKGKLKMYFVRKSA